MTKKGYSKSGGQGKSTCSAPKTVAKIGLISHAPMKTTTKICCKGAKGGGGGGGEGSYETKSKMSVGDKKTGSYGRVTTKEKMSGGAFQYKNGTSGVKSEYKTSSTVRVGDKHGYTEVYKEERFRNVSYDNKSSGGSNNLISYGDYGDYGSGSGSGCDSYYLF